MGLAIRSDVLQWFFSMFDTESLTSTGLCHPSLILTRVYTAADMTEGDLVVSVALEVPASVLAHVVGEGSGWRAVVTGNLMTLG